MSKETASVYWCNQMKQRGCYDIQGTVWKTNRVNEEYCCLSLWRSLISHFSVQKTWTRFQRITLRMLRSMNKLSKERLESFIWEDREIEIKKCSIMQNNELYEGCSPTIHITVFQNMKTWKKRWHWNCDAFRTYRGKFHIMFNEIAYSLQ